jgi:7-carboxy-7-deazaguanine synthase
MLLVNEIFENFQGEGYWTGRYSTFLRLQGCSVGCNFCDTKHTWTRGSSFTESKKFILMKEKENNSSSYWKADEQDLLNELKTNVVVITGGEPLEQDIGYFVNSLLKTGKQVQIETSGCFALLPKDQNQSNLWQTVSPKFTKRASEDFVIEQCKQADEVKFVITRDNLLHLDRVVSSNSNIFVQPEYGDFDWSLEMCKKIAKERNVRISFQVHKFIKER